MAVFDLSEDYRDRVNAKHRDVKSEYDSAHWVTSTERLDRARSLVSQIGTIDFEGEGYQSMAHQRDLSIKFCWGHNHRFTEGFSVEGQMGNRHTRLLSEFTVGFQLSPDFFAGKDVVDIGCWTGGTTLTLKMSGARRVLALEEVRKYAAAAQELVTGVYGHQDVTCSPQSLYHLTEGRFDLAYIPGVVYHLSDPVVGLRRLFNRLRDGGEILIESAGIPGDQAICSFRGNQQHFGGTEENLDRSGWAWFWPTATTLDMWMQEAGFNETRAFCSPFGNRVFGYGKRTEYQDITRAGLSVPDID